MNSIVTTCYTLRKHKQHFEHILTALHSTTHSSNKANNMQAYNKQHSFSYNAELAKQYEIAADDYLGQFVNCNPATTQYAITLELDDAQAAFERELAGKYTHINDEAYPVLVYMDANAFVAWYDWENMCGYNATQQLQAA